MELMRASQEQHNQIKEQIEQEKQELKQEWEKLKMRIEQDQQERENFHKVIFLIKFHIKSYLK